MSGGCGGAGALLVAVRTSSSVLMLIAAAAAAAAAKPTVTAAPRPPKHFAFFLIDDYGFADASYKNAMYPGAAASPPTPTIDALAMSGVRLESYYVNKLCSPTRTALLSGRYAYTIGTDIGVIVDGTDSDLPLNLLTIADHFQRGGWSTSAFGKWDAGMTTWGSTPACRGFDLFRGFYSAASDYYNHNVGACLTADGQQTTGFDYHLDRRGAAKGPDTSVFGIYTTEAVTSAVQDWIQGQMADAPYSKTFAYIAHEAVHSPMEVPLRYIEGECGDLVGATYPTRAIYCGMVRAMDESVKNITQTYRELGILDQTLVVLSADNGGEPGAGGSNYPLRGMKATTFEGGVRGLAFVSGAGISQSMRGSVSHGLLHVSDWLPTLAAGAARIPGVFVDAAKGRPCRTCRRAVAPLDGVNNWAMLSTGADSARLEVLLDLEGAAGSRSAFERTTHSCIKGGPCYVPGSGALRRGKWKLIHGHVGGWDRPLNASATPVSCSSFKCSGCVARAGIPTPGHPALPSPPNESHPWCPYGWTPPPRADGKYELPRPPPDLGCGEHVTARAPCATPPSSTYLAGGTMLFDVVSDMYEEHDVAAQNPHVVEELLARLQRFNSSHCGGSHCEPDDCGGFCSPKGQPRPVPNLSMPCVHVGWINGCLPAWLPWRGDRDPARCDTNRTYAGGPF